MGHVLTTLHGLTAVCVKDEAVFDEALLDDRDQLQKLCDKAAG